MPYDLLNSKDKGSVFAFSTIYIWHFSLKSVFSAWFTHFETFSRISCVWLTDIPSDFSANLPWGNITPFQQQIIVIRSEALEEAFKDRYIRKRLFRAGSYFHLAIYRVAAHFYDSLHLLLSTSWQKSSLEDSRSSSA